MRVVIVGSGMREDALAREIWQHGGHEVIVHPGNPGILWSTPIPTEALNPDLIIVGPEAPLVNGLADQLRSQGKRVLGPGSDGAKLEGSKARMKQILAEAGVPTADPWGVFSDPTDAIEFVTKKLGGRAVIKTNGLAAGKGVTVATSIKAAEDDICAKLSRKKLDVAGKLIVVEPILVGEELSVTFLCDGHKVVLLPNSRDFKRLYPNGPMTGGVAAYSPVPGAPADAELLEMAQKVVDVLRRHDIDYRGVLYFGLMLTPEGHKVLEINVRFGDPEIHVIAPQVRNLVQLMSEAAAGQLISQPDITNQAAVTIVLCTDGYPNKPLTGDVIHGLDVALSMGVTILYGGVDRDTRGRLVTAGGRVLAVQAAGPDVATARTQALAAAKAVTWPGRYFREDI